jgi:hypothetical protein
MAAPHTMNETPNSCGASHSTHNDSSGSDTVPCAPCHSANGSPRSSMAYADVDTQGGPSRKPMPITMSVATLDPTLLFPMPLDLDIQDLPSSSWAAQSAPNSSGLERTIDVRQPASEGVQNPAVSTLSKRLLKAVPPLSKVVDMPLALASSPMGASPASFAKQIVTASPFAPDAEIRSEGAANSDLESGQYQSAPSDGKRHTMASLSCPIGIRDTHESLWGVMQGRSPTLRKPSVASVESVYFSAASSVSGEEGNDDADASHTAVTPQRQGTGNIQNVKLFIV